jgi:hypothetical protein
MKAISEGRNVQWHGCLATEASRIVGLKEKIVCDDPNAIVSLLQPRSRETTFAAKILAI